MPDVVIVVDQRADYIWNDDGIKVITTRDYITRCPLPPGRSVKVVNLSRSYAYLGFGYYCSLLAEARRHKVVPTASTLLDFNQRSVHQTVVPEMETILRRTIARLHEPPEGAFTLMVYFGRPDDHRFVRLARKAFDRYRCPILKIKIHPDKAGGGWAIQSIRPVTLDGLDQARKDAFAYALGAFIKLGWRTPQDRTVPRYTLAVLHDPHETLPPSDRRALDRLARIGASMGLAVELIQKKDYSRLAEYDALFIRETTALDHHTYRFARKASAEGMAVIDDPVSILRCTNKVYLAELLAAHKVPTPKTVAVDRKRLKDLERELPYPMVLKVPDGAFSRGVKKVDNARELRATARAMFEDSDIILAQEFMYTAYDWRVGVLNRKPLYVCQYAMARKHWQIIRHKDGGSFDQGGFKSFAVSEAPRAVVETAVKAAGLIGDGLYGVDLKQNERGVFVVEINDNPNIDAGVEDAHLKDDLYRLLLSEFLRRIEGRPNAGSGGGNGNGKP